MSELQFYYDNFATQPSRWSNQDPDRCGCRGSGWFLSEVDTWHECPKHYKDQPHPEYDDYIWPPEYEGPQLPDPDPVSCEEDDIPF
jgi:hypothetical protein